MLDHAMLEKAVNKEQFIESGVKKYRQKWKTDIHLDNTVADAVCYL